MAAVVGAVVNWVQARPWRGGGLLAGVAVCSLIAPVAGGVAWMLVAPLAMFVIGYDLWWFLRGWKGPVALGVAVAWAIAVWAVFGVGFGSFTEAAYTLGGAVTTVALLAGYLWGRRREAQERSAQLAEDR
jgi:hypothetical protein